MKRITNLIIVVSILVSITLFSQNKTGYRLVWEDNFNGKTIDTTAWTHEAAPAGWVNWESQRYTNGDNVKLSDGKLLIVARYENGEYTSARLITKDKRIFTYGIIEIKAKLPPGAGTWPALWMLGQNIDKANWPDCGELDILEHVGREPGIIHSSVHNLSGYGATPYTGVVKIENPYSRYHVYSMEWTTDYICFYVDGRSIYKYQPVTKDEKTWPFDKPAYLIMNIAIGGAWGGTIDNSIFPTTMTIDWVKVYKK